jgi:hypothetical protein
VRDRDHLLKQTGEFEKELASRIRPWTERQDPLNERPWLTIEESRADGVRWRKRVRLFNRHFLEFLITNDGRLYVCTSDGVHKHYDRGITVPSPASHMELRLEYSGDDSQIGTPLEMVLVEHIERLADLPDLQEEGGTEVGG